MDKCSVCREQTHALIIKTLNEGILKRIKHNYIIQMKKIEPDKMYELK